MARANVLLHIECQKRQVEHERQPVPINQKQDSQESVNSRLRNNVCVKAVAQIDGIDVITAISSSAIISPEKPTPIPASPDLQRKPCVSRPIL
jgi:hypothetical protein